jgi:hypothetical protein
MNLDKYKKPAGVRFDVEGAVFLVELPTRWNKPYNRSWQEALSNMAEVAADGTVSMKGISPAKLTEAQLSAFVAHCIVEGPLPAEDLLGDYAPLTEALFAAAEKLANEAEASADALVGKLSPISPGGKNGAANSISTPSSKHKAALQPAM